MKTLTTAELKERKEQGDATIINVLPREQYEAKHIPGSINIPIDTPDFAQQVEQATGSKHEPIVVYCANPTCPASDQAAEVLDKEGFQHVADFHAGTEGWQESGLPVASC